MKLFNSADLYLIGAPNLQPQPYEAQMSGYGNQAQSYGIKTNHMDFKTGKIGFHIKDMVTGVTLSPMALKHFLTM